jgi:hypothetical protein
MRDSLNYRYCTYLLSHSRTIASVYVFFLWNFRMSVPLENLDDKGWVILWKNYFKVCPRVWIEIKFFGNTIKHNQGRNGRSTRWAKKSNLEILMLFIEVMRSNLPCRERVSRFLFIALNFAIFLEISFLSGKFMTFRYEKIMVLAVAYLSFSAFEAYYLRKGYYMTYFEPLFKNHF